MTTVNEISMLKNFQEDTKIPSFFGSPTQLFADSDPGRVLVVEDHADSRLVAVDQLQSHGYEIFEVENASDVFSNIMDNPPDVILLGGDLLTGNGFELCRQLKKEQHSRSIPIILMVMGDDPRLRSQGQMAGANQVLSKPLERTILLSEVERHIQQKRMVEWLQQLHQVLFLISQTVENRCSAGVSSGFKLDELALSFGEYLQLSVMEINDLILAAHLHDIGMVGIPDSILLKQQQLTESERKTIEQHVLIGEKIFEPMQSRRGVAQIIRHHHERWNGSGYPDGLHGKDIPWLAQVFQVLDIYDALTRKRPYQIALSSTDALKVLQDEAEKGWRNPEFSETF